MNEWMNVFKEWVNVFMYIPVVDDDVDDVIVVDDDVDVDIDVVWTIGFTI